MRAAVNKLVFYASWLQTRSEQELGALAAAVQCLWRDKRGVNARMALEAGPGTITPSLAIPGKGVVIAGAAASGWGRLEKIP